MNFERVERATLREPHFRLWEPWIGKACKGTIQMDPLRDFPQPISPATLVHYIREALLSYRKNRWNSKVIPIDFNTKLLVTFETKEGKVVIQNEVQDRLNSSKKESVVIQNGVPTYFNSMTKPTKWLVFGTHCGEEIFRKVKTVSGAEKPEHDSVLEPVLVPPQFAELRETHSIAARCDWEPLAEGWWRVTGI